MGTHESEMELTRPRVLREEAKRRRNTSGLSIGTREGYRNPRKKAGGPRS